MKEFSALKFVYGVAIIYLCILLTSLLFKISYENNKKNNEPIEVTEEATEEIIETEETEERTLEATTEEELEEVTETESQIEKPKLISMGIFKLTAYCSCHICCGRWALNRPIDEYGNEIVYGASGERLSPNYSIAVDPNVIPFGTEVVINGHTYKAQDSGSGIKGNDIDIYFTNHDEAWNFGVKYAEVFIVH